MIISKSTNQEQWDTFLASQPFSPFLQSWTMGEVYKEVGEDSIRLEVRDGDAIVGICQAIVVPARRGRHLAVMYGPILDIGLRTSDFGALLKELKRVAEEKECSFIRISPFWQDTEENRSMIKSQNVLSSPLHLLAEHIQYLPLIEPNPWTLPRSEVRGPRPEPIRRTKDEILKNMRKTTRYLIRRAGKEGVEVSASDDPVRDLPLFIELHEETRKRHGFTPYTNAFFRAQVAHFAPRNECTLYLARYNGEVIASSIHMHAFGETSYHHGASTHKYPKIPASYLLQWTAITDALKRGDRIYNFWGIAPEGVKKHPFKGVTTFKTGFGGQILELVHCMDIPLSKRYYLTRAFETLRKWRRGF